MTDTRTITPKDNNPPLIDIERLRKDHGHLETELAALEAVETAPVLEDDDDLALLTKTIVDLKAFEKKAGETREKEKRPIIDAGNLIQNFFKVGLQDRALARVDVLDKIGRTYLKKKAERERKAREAAAEAAALAAQEAQRQAEAARAKTETMPGIPTAVEAIKASATADALTDFANKAARDATGPMTSFAATRTAGGSAGLQTEWTFENLDVNTIDLQALRPFIPQAAIEQALRAFIKSGRRKIDGADIVEDAKARWRK
jgi:hypothetical protein